MELINYSYSSKPILIPQFFAFYFSVHGVQENMHPVTLAYYINIPSERPPLYGPVRKVGASPINTWLLVT